MVDQPSKSFDLLGIKPIGDAAKRVTEGLVDGISAFLSRICLPAAEELGLLFRDRVTAWRANNALAIAAKAERTLHESGAPEGHAHPRLVGQILEQGSWSDDDKVQEMWSGLLASACTERGDDDSNMMFVDLLSRLSVSQVRVLDFACTTAVKLLTPGGWLYATHLRVSVEKLEQVAGVTHFQRLDRELDHLRTLGMLPDGSGFNPHSTDAGLTPTALALHMFARCNGHRGNPIEFYGLKANAVRGES